MASRLELHEEFCKILESKNVYFQPPSSVTMKYRCIRYSKATPDIKRANNSVYRVVTRYEGVVIDTNPDCDIPDKLLAHFQYCSLGNAYVADGLNHFPFTIYY